MPDYNHLSSLALPDKTVLRYKELASLKMLPLSDFDKEIVSITE